MKMPPLSVVIPCKNEEESIFLMISELKDVLNKKNIQYEIIVVDNNSTDASAYEAQKVPHVRVVPCKEPGYGAAIMEGVRSASYEYICKLDADGSYNPADIDPLYKKLLHSGGMLAMGNRFSGGNTHNIKFLHKIIGVPALNFITNFLFRAPEHIDSHCGLRIFKKELIETLRLKQHDFSFANEMVCKALKKKISIVQIPIVLRKDLRVHTTSKIKTIRDGFYALMTILRTRFTNI